MLDCLVRPLAELLSRLLGFFAGLPEAGLLLLGIWKDLRALAAAAAAAWRRFASGLSMLLRCEDLEGEFAVGFGSAGFGVVEGYGFAVAGGFGEADVAGDGGLEELVVEEGL